MADLHTIAEESEYSGVVRVRRNGVVVEDFARGFANRALEIPIQTSTRLAGASATKGLTALCVMALCALGKLDRSAPIRSLLGGELANLDDAVTIEHLLSHRSGIGDYLDEEAIGDIDDHMLDVSMHTLELPSDYLAMLSLPEQVAAPGSCFAYNNSGFVVLSYLVEIATGSFHRSVADLVLSPAGMTDSGFFRSDDLPADTALGYLKDGRTNVHHLPVVGAGDGGAYLTLDDVDRLWTALFAGQIVPSEIVAEMVTPISDVGKRERYGLGFWLSGEDNIATLVGMDAGVSFHSSHDPATGTSHTLISNTSSGVWPLVRAIEGMQE